MKKKEWVSKQGWEGKELVFIRIPWNHRKPWHVKIDRDNYTKIIRVETKNNNYNNKVPMTLK